MEFKPDMQLYKDQVRQLYYDFFNSPCWSNYCLRQSYPEFILLKIILRQDHLKQIWLKYVQILF